MGSPSYPFVAADVGSTVHIINGPDAGTSWTIDSVALGAAYFAAPQELTSYTNVEFYIEERKERMQFRLHAGIFPSGIIGKLLRIEDQDYLIKAESEQALLIDPVPGTHPAYVVDVCERTLGTTLAWGDFLDWQVLEVYTEFVDIIFEPVFTSSVKPHLWALATMEFTICDEEGSVVVPVWNYEDFSVFVDWAPVGKWIIDNITGEQVADSTHAAPFKATLSQILTQEDPDETFITEYFSEISPQLTKFLAHTYLRSDVSALDVPHLQEEIATLDGTVYTQYSDYELANKDEAHYIKWNTTSTTVSWAGKRITCPAGPVDYLYLDNGTVLAPYNWNGTAAEVGYEAPVAGTFNAEVPQHSTFPSTWWAELVGFENDPTIDRNFGAAVGFPLVDQDNYKSDVTGIWFAFWHGPTISNMETMANALLDRQLFLTEGTVVNINDTYTSTEGRIFVQDATGTILSFPYTRSLGLAENPKTGAPYAVGDEVEKYWPIAGGIDIEDAVSWPVWFAKHFQGDDYLKKFHTFTVRLSGGTIVEDDLEKLVEIVDDFKPEYSKAIFIHVRVVETDIDVIEKPTFSYSLAHHDTISYAMFTQPVLEDGTLTAYASPVATDGGKAWTINEWAGHIARFVTTGAGLQTWARVVSNTATALTLDTGLTLLGTEDYEIRNAPEQVFPHRYPKTGLIVNDVDGTVMDNVEVYESGYMAGRVDDFSGDGSWHPDAPMEPVDSGVFDGGVGPAYDDSTKTWTPNAMVGDVAYTGNPATAAGVITANTATQITLNPDPGVGAGTGYQIYTTKSRVEPVNLVDGDEDYSKSLVWIEGDIALDGFQLNEWIFDQTGPGRARLLYISNYLNQGTHQRCFMLVQRRNIEGDEPIRMDSADYVDFPIGAGLEGETSGARIAVVSTHRFPVEVFEVDIGRAMPRSNPGVITSYYVGPNGHSAAVDEGLVVDDLQPHDAVTLSPLDLSEENTCPSMYLGQYWWVDTPIMTDYVDVEFPLPGAYSPGPAAGSEWNPGQTIAPNVFDYSGDAGAIAAANNFWVGQNVAIYNSGLTNDGLYRIIAINLGANQFTVAGAPFVNEVGLDFVVRPSTWQAPEVAVKTGDITGAGTFVVTAGAPPVIGEKFLIFDSATAANNAMWDVTNVVGATVTLAGAPLGGAFPEVGVTFINQPSWWQDFKWGNVDPDFVARDQVVFRWEAYGDKIPNWTHGFTSYEFLNYLNLPAVLAMIPVAP